MIWVLTLKSKITFKSEPSGRRRKCKTNGQEKRVNMKKMLCVNEDFVWRWTIQILHFDIMENLQHLFFSLDSIFHLIFDLMLKNHKINSKLKLKSKKWEEKKVGVKNRNLELKTETWGFFLLVRVFLLHIFFVFISFLFPCCVLCFGCSFVLQIKWKCITKSACVFWCCCCCFVQLHFEFSGTFWILPWITNLKHKEMREWLSSSFVCWFGLVS